jgi:hypothetical protein
MDNATKVVALLRKQAEFESLSKNGDSASASDAEPEYQSSRWGGNKPRILCTVQHTDYAADGVPGCVHHKCGAERSILYRECGCG